MKLTILDKTKKKKFIEGISNFGVSKVPELLIRTGSERVRAYSGSLSKEEIMDIWKILPIEGVGLYVGKDLIDRHGVREIRLSVDGLHTWQNQITKDIFVLSESQEEEWFKGKNIELDKIEKEGFVAVKSNDEKDFVGMGKIGAGGKILFNFLPKERRRKSQVI